ncbi:transcriptional regulator [Caballeronia cordobensis]|uniref:Transcriptional regulator n=1 Tax=Caballeronia cordobensis TaxID=1353886 RepID=A0A158J755_CABCO|nr:PLP-dependent aminotransferase family protein [Caballeronia cordobensis]SAL64734.1 transcriptional regulator [Caballeronia cordobensis]
MERFRQVAELVKKRLDSGLIRPGDKLPSLRRLAEETGFSVVTVYKAYELLESQGICASRDRSGFYALKAPQRDAQRRAHALPVMSPDNVRSLDEAFASRVPFHAKASAMMLQAGESLADPILRKTFRRALLETPSRSADMMGGDAELRTAIARRAAQRGIHASRDQVVVTRSAMEAFNLCLDSFSTNNRPVLVESPSFYPILESLRHRQIQAIEIYSHPEFGIDPGQFEHILETTGVKLSVLTGANRIPTGMTYDRETSRRLVQAAERHGAVIIENAISSELTYGALNASTLKEFDRFDTVIQFGGTASTLSSNYEIGWILGNEQRAARILASQQLSGLNMPHRALQAALASYLNSRLAERHTRANCQFLAERMKQGLELMRASFPEQTAFCEPSGGFMCWVRGPRHFDPMKLAMSAAKDVFDFIPGPFFSPAGAFRNFLALNFSGDWTQSRRRKLIRLGECLRGDRQ